MRQSILFTLELIIVGQKVIFFPDRTYKNTTTKGPGYIKDSYYALEWGTSNVGDNGLINVNYISSFIDTPTLVFINANKNTNSLTYENKTGFSLGSNLAQVNCQAYGRI